VAEWQLRTLAFLLAASLVAAPLTAAAAPSPRHGCRKTLAAWSPRPLEVRYRRQRSTLWGWGLR